MELTVTHMVRKPPFSSPSDDTSFGSCPPKAVLSPSAVAAEAVPSLGNGTARLGDAVPTKQTSSVRSSPPYDDSESNRPPSASPDGYELVSSTNVQQERRTGHSVLVVEDDPDIAMGLHDLLEFEGFGVDCVPTCRQAFSSIEQHAYDAVLLDLGLPDGDGLSVLERLQGSHPSLPVILFTASDRDLGSVRAYARLTKPCDRKKLCMILRQATGQAPSSITI